MPVAPRPLALLPLALLLACQPERNASEIPDQDLGAAEDEGEAPLVFNADDRLSAPAGQWALFHEDHHCLAAVGDTIENVVSTWFRVDIEDLSGPPANAGDPRLQRESARLCNQEISPVLFDLVSHIPQAIPESMAPVVTDSTLLGEDAGDAYVSGLQLDLWGVAGVTEDDEMPTEGDDPRVTDQEGDDSPGATISLWDADGNDGCFISIVQRTTARRTGKIIDASRIEGSFIGDLTQRVLEATSPLCASDNAITDGGRPSRFVLLRIDGNAGSPDLDSNGDANVSCGELLSASSALLASADFTRQPRKDEVCVTP